MDVGSAVAHRLGEEGVDEAHDRGVVLALHQVAGLRQILRQFRQVEVLVEIVHDVHGLRHAAFVGAVKGGIEQRRGQLAHRDGLPERAIQFRQRGAGDAGLGPDLEQAVTQAGADDAVPAREVIRQALGPGGVEGLQVGRVVHGLIL